MHTSATATRTRPTKRQKHAIFSQASRKKMEIAHNYFTTRIKLDHLISAVERAVSGVFFTRRQFIIFSFAQTRDITTEYEMHLPDGRNNENQIQIVQRAIIQLHHSTRARTHSSFRLFWRLKAQNQALAGGSACYTLTSLHLSLDLRCESKSIFQVIDFWD